MSFAQLQKLLNDTLTNKLDEYFTSENSMGVQEQDLELMRAKASVLLPEYIKFYAKDFTDKKFIDVEKVFSIPFCGVTLKGKKDGVYQAKDKSLWLMEHKCYSRIDEENFMLILALNLQNLFYITAEELESKKEIRGCLYNIIRNPGQKFLKDDNVKTYCDRLLKEVQKNPAHFFIRYEIPYTRKDKEAFLKDLKIWIGRINDLLHCATSSKHEIYCRNLSSCEGKYNCQYLQVCIADKLTGDYFQREKIYPELED